LVFSFFVSSSPFCKDDLLSFGVGSFSIFFDLSFFFFDPLSVVPLIEVVLVLIVLVVASLVAVFFAVVDLHHFYSLMIYLQQQISQEHFFFIVNVSVIPIISFGFRIYFRFIIVIIKCPTNFL